MHKTEETKQALYLAATSTPPLHLTMLALALSIIVCGLLTPTWSYADINGFPRVIDGDTLEVTSQKIRIHGIDTPERKQFCVSDGEEWPCGELATRHLIKMISRQEVQCIERDKDRYGRIIGKCTTGGKDIGSEMVRVGLALAYRKYSTDYIHEEEIARKNAVGMWAGEFVPPWEWRKGKRLNTASSNTDCPIKGNVNSKKQRIYHTPTGRYYHRTKIKTHEGDKCFQSEAQALAAGFRKSKR